MMTRPSTHHPWVSLRLSHHQYEDAKVWMRDRKLALMSIDRARSQLYILERESQNFAKVDCELVGANR